MEIKDPAVAEQVASWQRDHAQGKPRVVRRYVEIEVRMSFEDQKIPKIEGHAAVFNKRSEIWPGFFEEVAPGAFRDALSSPDIYALWNHEPSNVLGNTGAKTLFLSEDEIGLRYQIIPPDTTLGRDLTTLIKRGDVRKSSFGFNIDDEEVTKIDGGKGVLRRILKVSPLFDVSPVTYPAYKETDVHVRMIAGSQETAYLFEDSDRVLILPAEAKIEPPTVTDEDLFKQFDELKGRAFN